MGDTIRILGKLAAGIRELTRCTVLSYHGCRTKADADKGSPKLRRLLAVMMYDGDGDREHRRRGVARGNQRKGRLDENKESSG